MGNKIVVYCDELPEHLNLTEKEFKNGIRETQINIEYWMTKNIFPQIGSKILPDDWNDTLTVDGIEFLGSDIYIILRK